MMIPLKPKQERRRNWLRFLIRTTARLSSEQECLHTAFAVHQRLKEMGWQEIEYCPKDGTHFDAIEPGSTGIHDTWYEGTWPDGSWWGADGGDIWPCRPTMFRARTIASHDQEG